MDNAMRLVISEMSYLEEIPVQELKQHAGDDAVVRLAKMILLKSVNGNEEDILLEPMEREVEIRLGSSEAMRVDSRLPASVFPVLSMCIKQWAALDLADVNSKQHGRMRFRLKGRDVNLRLTSLPGEWGEQLHLKVLTHEMESN